MTRETLLVEFGPGLALRFEQFPAVLTPSIEDVFGAFIVDQTAATPLLVTAESDNFPAKSPDAELLTTRDCVRVYHHASALWFEAPGIRAWCNTKTEAAGLKLADATPEIAHNFTAIALMSLVFELAITRDWFGMHAAAVAVDGKGVLLPGDSGVGKSTIYRNAAAAGFDTLSSDLVWLRETPSGVEIRPLPRGSIDADAPPPSVNRAALTAIVCPSIAEADTNHLGPLPVPDLLQTMVRQSGFLSPAQHVKRFSMLTRIAGSAPRYRLSAGRDQQGVPAMLRSLLS